MTPRTVLTTATPAALLLALALLLVASLPAPAGAASRTATPVKLYPSIQKVSPKKSGIGDRMTITGKSFRKGKNKNTVVLKRDGKRAVFIRATGTSTKRISFRIPAKLLPMLAQKSGKPVSTRFRVRVLAARFGKRYTSVKSSPMIGPLALGAKSVADDCDGDGIRNATDKDDDNDLLSDAEEATLKTKPCVRDSDADGMSDGWEHHSSLDRNGKAVPAPTRKPYPNALDGSDGAIDHDGDGLTNVEEYIAWVTLSSSLRAVDSNPLTSRLTYSGGNPASDGRARRPDALAYMDRDGNGFLSDFERDADGDQIPNMDEQRTTLDAARGLIAEIDDPRFFEFGLFGQVYMDLIAVTQSKQDQPRCGGINQVPFYCLDALDSNAVKVSKVDTLDWVDADSDGDGLRDDIDDVDHDDVPNMQEYLEELATPNVDRVYRHLDACIPNSDSRYCLLGGVDIDRDGQDNRDDADDDGDLLPDTEERRIRTDPLRADSDGDGVSDGFEYLSAVDLNSTALPYPGKRPYPNPLDGDDAKLDHDSDSLTLEQEYEAWRLTGSPLPLSYSAGTQWTGGKNPFASYPAGAGFDNNGDGTLSDNEKDVDQDGLANDVEANSSLSDPKWWDVWVNQESVKCFPEYVETPYPGPAYLGLDFVDPDSDGDGLKDGPDDIDHDGFTNAQEQRRPGNWCSTYISVGHPGTDRFARVQPFNPCKPVYSDACHVNAPLGYYKAEEDWESPFHQNGP